MTQLTTVLEEIAKAPATSEDVSMATGIPKRSCSAYCSELRGMGLIRQIGEIRREGVAHPFKLYEVVA